MNGRMIISFPTDVKRGRIWKVKRADISNWMLVRDDKTHGNYTLCPLLKTMKPQEAEVRRAQFAEP